MVSSSAEVWFAFELRDDRDRDARAFADGFRA